MIIVSYCEYFCSYSHDHVYICRRWRYVGEAPRFWTWVRFVVDVPNIGVLQQVAG